MLYSLSHLQVKHEKPAKTTRNWGRRKNGKETMSQKPGKQYPKNQGVVLRVYSTHFIGPNGIVCAKAPMRHALNVHLLLLKGLLLSTSWAYCSHEVPVDHSVLNCQGFYKRKSNDGIVSHRKSTRNCSDRWVTRNFQRNGPGRVK